MGVGTLGPRHSGLQLPAQHLDGLPDCLLVSAVPAPLALLVGFDQSGFRQDCHVVRDGWLGQAYAFLDFSAAKARSGFPVC